MPIGESGVHAGAGPDQRRTADLASLSSHVLKVQAAPQQEHLEEALISLEPVLSLLCVVSAVKQLAPNQSTQADSSPPPGIKRWATKALERLDETSSVH